MSRQSVIRYTGLLVAALALGTGLNGCERSDDGLASADAVAQDQSAALTVFKSAQCGCCEKWITHLEKSGFNVSTTETNNLQPIKKRFGIEPRHQSCHTALSADGDYVFEGHIPADVIQRFLEAPPEGAAGLTVPGMPPGSPGMETGADAPPYDVLVLYRDGSTAVYTTVEARRFGDVE